MASSSSRMRTLPICLLRQCCGQRLAADWLGQVVIDAVLQPRFVLVADMAVDGGDDDDAWRVGGLGRADETADLEAVHVGEELVDDDDDRSLQRREADRFIAGRGLDRLVSERAHVIDHGISGTPVIIDDEHQTRVCLDGWWKGGCYCFQRKCGHCLYLSLLRVSNQWRREQSARQWPDGGNSMPCSDLAD